MFGGGEEALLAQGIAAVTRMAGDRCSVEQTQTNWDLGDFLTAHHSASTSVVSVP